MTYTNEIEKEASNREVDIIEIINEYREIHHNDLIRKIRDKGLMAKKTAERNIKILIEKNIVDSYKSGNKLFYSIKPILDHYDLELERQIIPLNLIISNLIKITSRDYKGFSVEVKISRLSYIFALIFRALNCCAVLDAIKNPKSKASIKYESDLKMKIRNLLELIRNDSDSKIVYSFISDSFSPIQRSRETQLR